MKNKEKIFLGIVALVLVVLCFVLVRQYKDEQRLNAITSRQSLLSLLRSRGAATSNNVSLVSSWMTFDYIDHLFALPPDYLKTTLSIDDGRYPRLAIEEYAEGAHLNPPEFLISVQHAIQAYLATSTASSTIR